MKLKHFAILLAVVTAGAFAGCKKSNSSPTSASGQPTLPSDAAGAFYAITVTALGTPSYTVTAWLSSYYSTQTVTSLTCNTVALTDSAPIVGTQLPWYVCFNPVDLSANAVVWANGGNSSAGIPAFTYTDNTTWPSVNAFNLPSQVALNSTLNVSFTPAVLGNQIIATISGQLSNQSYSKNLPANATSVSFSPAEIAKVSNTAGDNLAVQIMPISYTSQTYGGKKYYFVKQNGQTEYATTY